jgi:hypothetical protein
MQTPDTHRAADAPAVRIRAMQAEDASTVAALHAASWRRAYRGILTHTYLDSDGDGEACEALKS